MLGILIFLGIVVVLVMAAIGIYISRRQTSLERYLLAARKLGWLPGG